jgi:hypothetical protein
MGNRRVTIYPSQKTREISELSTINKRTYRRKGRLKRVDIQKVKVQPITCHENRGGGDVQLYSFFNFGVGWEEGQSHAPAAFPGMTQYLLHRRMGGPLDVCGKYRLRRDSMPEPSTR